MPCSLRPPPSRPVRLGALACLAALLAAVLPWPGHWSLAMAQAVRTVQDGGLFSPSNPLNPQEDLPRLTPPEGRNPTPGTWWQRCPYDDLNVMCQRYDSFYDPNRGLYFSREGGGWRAEAQSRDFHRGPDRNPSRRPHRPPHDREYDPFRSPYDSSPPSGSGDPFSTSPYKQDPFSTSPYQQDPFSTSPYERDPFTTRPGHREPSPSRPPQPNTDSWQWRGDHWHGRGGSSGGGVYEYRPKGR